MSRRPAAPVPGTGPSPDPDTLDVPGSRFQVLIAFDAVARRHRAAIIDTRDHSVPVLASLDSSELVELTAAMKAAEKEVWRRDMGLPSREICRPLRMTQEARPC